ncbi:hypothetical protein [Algihabitans sp.]|uniref:hypothetical protein n=1 Tax=Algihabitans sp. TaxID=2821514 RepID=UPI003BA88D4F
MAEHSVPAAPRLPETAIVLGSAAAASAAMILLAANRFGATAADWPGLAAATATLFFTGLAVLAGTPRGWRWIGATVCAHLGLHPWLAEAATVNPLGALSAAFVALAVWISLGLLSEQRLQGWASAPCLGLLGLGLLAGLSVLVRPDLPVLILPLAALAVGLRQERRRLWRDLALFTLAGGAAGICGLLLRGQIFGLDSRWAPGNPADLYEFVRINAVGITAGLAALALLGKRAWRQAALLFLPLAIFASVTLGWSLQQDGTRSLYLPLLPLTAITFGVLLARALDALPALRPRDDLGKIAALILGLVFVFHLLPPNGG